MPAHPSRAVKRLTVTATAVAVTVAATLGLASTATASPAERIDCSTVHPSLSGVLVITSSGMFNANCNTEGPAYGGGAFVLQCSDLMPGLTGNIVFQPNDQFKGHCR